MSVFGKMYKAVWSGTLGSPEEIFSYSRHYGSDADLIDTAYVADALVDDVAALLEESVLGSSPFGTVAGAFPSHVAWTLLKVYKVDAATGANLSIVPEERVLTDVGSGATGLGLPYQDAHAVTWRSALRGVRERNRHYFPPYCSNATNGKGRVITPLIEALGTHFHLTQTSYRALEQAFELVVYSPRDAANKTVIDTYIGDVIDTIRRRRNKLVEARTIHSMP
jgi:hypothetical protein